MPLNAGRQKGYFLLALTAGLAVVAFGFVAAYSGLLAKKEQRALLDSQKEYMEQARSSFQQVYEANAAVIDSDASESAYRNPDVFMQLAGIKSKWGATTQVSNRLTSNGLKYTVIALWLPTETDSTNPPSFDPNTGKFTSCTVSGAECADRAYVVFSGLDVQKKLQEKAIKQLNELASIHQSYFKSRLLQDPDKDLSVNYFRAPDGNCSNQYNMPCIDTFTAEKDTSVGTLLGIPDNLMLNPWGMPVEVSNKDPASLSPPYSMAFRSATPWGTYYTISALQPV